MGELYSHLNETERRLIKQWSDNGLPVREIGRRLDTAVNHPESEAIMDKQHTLKKDPEILYQHYVNNVTALTGETFSCPDLKIYFQETLK